VGWLGRWILRAGGILQIGVSSASLVGFFLPTDCSQHWYQVSWNSRRH